jgi:hypothetical protein
VACFYIGGPNRSESGVEYNMGPSSVAAV